MPIPTPTKLETKGLDRGMTCNEYGIIMHLVRVWKSFEVVIKLTNRNI